MFEIEHSRVEKTSANVSILARCSTLSAFGGCATIKAEDYQTPSSSVDKGREASIQLDSPTPKVKKEIPEGIVDDPDHIVLKERLRMLLAGYFMLLFNIFSLVGLLNIHFVSLPSLTLFLNLLKQQ